MLGLGLFLTPRAQAHVSIGIGLVGPGFYPYGYGPYYGYPYYAGYYGGPYYRYGYRSYGYRYGHRGYGVGYNYRGHRYYEGRSSGRHVSHR